MNSMPQRFVICTNSTAGLAGANAADRNKITNYFEAKKWDVWHWFEDVWLVLNPSDKRIQTNVLRDELQALFSPLQRHLLIIEVSDQLHYSGWAPKNGWPWMLEKWGTPQ